MKIPLKPLFRLIFMILFFIIAGNLSDANAGIGAGRGRGLARMTPEPEAVYAYREVDGMKLEGDFYLPESGEGPYPTVVLIHGGAWKSGDKRAMAPYAAKLVERGYACFSINYRLTPKGRFPNNVNDCKAAVQWLRRWSHRLNIYSDRIAAWGGSAGGHLSAFIGATDDDDGFNAPEYGTSGRVQAVVPLYGVFDFTGFENGRSSLGRNSYFKPVEGPLIDHLKKISPATYVTPDDPPVFLIHGVEDSVVPVEQSEDYSKLLQENGIRSELLLVEGAEHGLKPIKGMEMSPTWDEAIDAAIDFLDEVL